VLGPDNANAKQGMVQVTGVKIKYLCGLVTI